MNGGPKKSDKITYYFVHHCEAVDVTELWSNTRVRLQYPSGYVVPEAHNLVEENSRMFNIPLVWRFW